MMPLRQTWPEDFARRYREAGYWRGQTLGGFLQDRAEAHPDRLAVVDRHDRWTYAELDHRANAIAAGLLDAGLQPGDRVVMQMPNVCEFLSTAFGLFRAGIIPVFALPAHRRTEITYFARAAEASAYIISDVHENFDFRELAEQVVRECPDLRVFVSGESGRFISLNSITEMAGPFNPPAVESRDAVLMQLSGGSTGLSKLIPRTHDDYLYSIRASAEICNLDESSVYMGTIPIAHNFPMSSPGTLGTLYAGGRVVLTPSPSPDVAFPIIEKEHVTITGVVPPIALLWLDAAATTRHNLSSLEVLQIGGAKLMPEVARRVRPALGATLQQVFGMAEGLVNYTRLDDPEDVIVTTQGRPISPDDEIKVVDDEGNTVPRGTAGNLLTRGPYTIRAYHNAPEANARAFDAEGYYHTGDIVTQLADGNLVVQGRATDQINRGGEKVSADEVEDHLLAHALIYDAAVVSIPDQYLGERTCAFVIPRGTAPRALEIKAWMRTRGLAAYKIPDQIVFVDAFPSTEVGKTSRKNLRAALRAQLANSRES